MPSVPTASKPRARRAPWSWSVSPFPSPRASTVPAAETLQTARVYLDAQTNKSMKAAAAAAIAIQTCVTIVPLVRAATSGSIDVLRILFSDAPQEQDRPEGVTAAPATRSTREGPAPRASKASPGRARLRRPSSLPQELGA